MRPKIIVHCLAVVLLAAVVLSAADKNDEKRDKTRKMAAQTLQDLYKLQPTAQAESRRRPDMPSSTTWA